jgi:hypothetical protein
MELGDAVRSVPIHNLARLEFWDAFYTAQRSRNRIAA